MITQTGSGNYVYRTWGDFPSNTESWTVFFYAKYGATPSGTAQLLKLEGSVGNEKVLIGNIAGTTSEIGLRVTSVAGTVTTVAATAVSTNSDIPVAVVYDSVGNTAALYVSNTLIGSTSINFTTAVWDDLQFLGGTTASGTVSVGYLRAWQRKLTLAELTAETSSITPITTANIIFNNPTQVSVDLTDHVRTGVNHFSPVGNVSTDFSDPLLALVAGPPSNIDATNAVTVAYTSAFYQVANTAGGTVAASLWTKFTPDETLVYGFISSGDLSIYRPASAIFEGLTNAIGGTSFLTTNPNIPLQCVCTAGVTYYLRSNRIATPTTASTLSVSVVKALNLTIPAGSLVINDVTPGFPLAVLDGEETGYPIRFVHPFAGGETAVMFASGRSVYEAFDIDGVILYNPSFVAITTPVVPTSTQVVGGNDNTAYVANVVATTNYFVSVDANGTVGSSVSFSTNSVNALAADHGNTVVYFVRGTTLREITIVGATVSTIFTTTTKSMHANLITLNDDKLIVPVRTTGAAPNDYAVQVMSDSGSVIAVHTYGTFTIEKVARGTNDPNDYWVWQQPTGEYSKFTHTETDGSGVLLTIDRVIKFNDGISQEAETLTPVRFGHSFSCNLLVTPNNVLPPVTARSGIYFLDFGKRNDTLWIDASVGTTENVAIP